MPPERDSAQDVWRDCDDSAARRAGAVGRGTLVAVRTVRLYDPSRHPRDWMDIVQPGQFAVFASSIDDGAPRSADDAPMRHDAATCVIVDSLAEAEALCRERVERHPALRFDVFDASGRSRPPLLTVTHPARASKVEGDASLSRRNLAIAVVLIVAAPVLFWLDWTSGGVLILPTLLGLNALLFAGRLLQLNAAYASAARRRRERFAGREQSGEPEPR